MNLRNEILKEHSQRHLSHIISWIGSDAKRFAQLMDIFLTGEYRVVQRSSWVVSMCAERHPELTAPWLAQLIARAHDGTVHAAVQRNVVRLLQFVDIPKRLQGAAVNLCFGFLSAVESPVAVKVFSMTVLAKLAEHEPDLKNEIIPLIEQMLLYGSAGIQSRAKKVLRRLAPR